MSTADIREMLIKKIQSTTDEGILLEASRLLEIQLSELDTPYILTDEMNLAVNESQAQIQQGDFLSHSEANKQIDEWLEE